MFEGVAEYEELKEINVDEGYIAFDYLDSDNYDLDALTELLVYVNDQLLEDVEFTWNEEKLYLTLNPGDRVWVMLFKYGNVSVSTGEFTIQ